MVQKYVFSSSHCSVNFEFSFFETFYGKKIQKFSKFQKYLSLILLSIPIFYCNKKKSSNENLVTLMGNKINQSGLLQRVNIFT